MRKPANAKQAPALAALATSVALMSCTAGPTGAMEQNRMSAALQDRSPPSERMPFQDPAIVPLAEAVAAGDVDRIRALAPAADLSAHGKDDVTLLEWAVWNERPESLAALLEAGADAAEPGMDRETVAHMAAMARDPKYLQVLIDHRAPVDVVSARAGRTPIFRAVQDRRDAQVDLLLKAGADVHRTDSMGNTLAHVAATVNDAAGVLRLLEAGVDPKATNARGQTFQAALFAGSDERLNAEGRAARQKVRDWLAARQIAQE